MKGKFGNMFSASVASVVLPFLPMLPGQILLNDLLYDTGQLAIPGDRVDREQIRSPWHWNIGYIRRFMLLFGPISSLFDFATFALMMLVFHAGHREFQAGGFIESIATQTLIIFAIRTRRVLFFRSRPSQQLAAPMLPEHHRYRRRVHRRSARYVTRSPRSAAASKSASASLSAPASPHP
jgi:P-type Mg2+ transporter